MKLADYPKRIEAQLVTAELASLVTSLRGRIEVIEAQQSLEVLGRAGENGKPMYIVGFAILSLIVGCAFRVVTRLNMAAHVRRSTLCICFAAMKSERGVLQRKLYSSTGTHRRRFSTGNPADTSRLTRASRQVDNPLS